MDGDRSAGPLAGAAWRPLGGGDASGMAVVGVPDAANPERTEAGLPALYHGLPAAPRLARDAAGRPVLSLSLVLRRRPAPGEDSVFDLVESASLACDLTLALPDGLSLSDGVGVRPLFARDAELTLEYAPRETLVAEPAPPPLAQVHGSGAGWRAGLAAQLDRAAAQGVLAALDGQASGLVLRCRIGYRAAGQREQLRLAIIWTDVRDVLAAHLGSTGGAGFSSAGLRALLPVLVEAEALRAWHVGAPGGDSPVLPAQAQDVWPAFSMLSSAVLERLTPELAPGDPQARFALREGVVPSDEIVTDWTLGSARDAFTELAAPLEAVLKGVLAGQQAEDHLHLVYPDPNAVGGYQPAPPRRRVLPSKAGPDAGPPRADMALVGGALMSMTRALVPDRARPVPLHAVLASDRIQAHAGVAHAFAIHDLELAEDGVVAGASVPRVDAPDGALWPDSVDPGLLWYAPEFELVQPDPAGSPAGSPFLFTYRQVGHDPDGQPTLEGSVRCTLRRRPGAATAAALAERGNPPARPVVPIGLAVTLSLPVRDDDGQLRRIELAGTVADGGAGGEDLVVAEIALLAKYVRAAYGSLALAGFQSEPARLQVAYSFDALVPTQAFVLTAAYAGKIARVPVAYTAEQQAGLAGREHVDALQLAYRTPLSDLQFKREAPSARVALPEPALALAEAGEGSGPDVPGMSGAPGAPPAMAVPAAGRAAVSHAGESPPIVAIHPELENTALQQELLRRRRFAHQVQGRQLALDAFFPCNTLGAFYCQQQDDALSAIGCRESFSLGQVPFKLYEELADPGLAGLPCKVLRSLSQPGRFVLLPASYLITRFGPAEGERAYRPAIYLYSSVDAEVPANNRCILMATLQPDLTPDQRHRIDAVLAALHEAPVADTITAIDCKVKQSDWLAGLAPEVARLWDGFQVTLTTDPAGALVLQEMLKHGGAAAAVTFTLDDGTELSSSLQLDLNRLTGPWDGGPVAVTAEGANAVLANRIERPVDVSDLAVVDAGGTVGMVPAERRLKAGETMSIALPAGARPGWAVYNIPPGDAATLEEIRSFVEDVQTNVLFINIINYANHRLQRLDLRARLKEVPGSECPVTMNAEQTMGEAVFMLPLTVYQGPRTLQFQVTKTFLDATASATGWLEADLRKGNAVTLSWDLIA